MHLCQWHWWLPNWLRALYSNGTYILRLGSHVLCPLGLKGLHDLAQEVETRYLVPDIKLSGDLCIDPGVN